MINKNAFLPELAALPNWVCWRLEKDAKKNRDAKVPYSPKTGKKASCSNPFTWDTLDEALYYAEKYMFSGIGFVFTEGCGIIGIDIDHCIENGALNETAADIISTLPPTYIEKSPSGTGLHIFLRGQIPTGGNRSSKTSVEMYAKSRYFTMTGDKYPGSADTIANDNGAINIIHQKYIAAPKRQLKKTTTHPSRPLTDDELLDLIATVF